jgi:hypothetical protein
MKANYKEVPNTNGRYAISIKGVILDVEKNKIINPHFYGNKRRNYFQVSLYIRENGVLKKRTKRIHSIMAETFLNHVYDGNRKIVVHHIDNNPLNNNLENLKIVSAKENHYRNQLN